MVISFCEILLKYKQLFQDIQAPAFALFEELKIK